jgi:hypothetical protein
MAWYFIQHKGYFICTDNVRELDITQLVPRRGSHSGIAVEEVLAVTVETQSVNYDDDDGTKRSGSTSDK